MQSVYTIYFNNGEDVTPIRYCNGYSHAEELMDGTINDFMKLYYTGLPRKTVDLNKNNEDVAIFSSQLYADGAFPNGVCFVRKRHNAMVYEKTCVIGVLRNSYAVKFLGRIGVIAQAYTISEKDQQIIDSLNLSHSRKDHLLSQQEQMIHRQDVELARMQFVSGRSDEELDQLRANVAKLSSELERANAEIEYLSSTRGDTPKVHVPLAPKRPTELSLKNKAISPVLDELKERFAKGTLLKKVRILCDDLELDRMISEINSLAIFNEHKIKIE